MRVNKAEKRVEITNLVLQILIQLFGFRDKSSIVNMAGHILSPYQNSLSTASNVFDLLNISCNWQHTIKFPMILI